MLGFAERGKVVLVSRKIIFQEFKPIWPRYLDVTDGRTDGQMDSQTTCLGNTALCYASRGKNINRRHRVTELDNKNCSIIHNKSYWRSVLIPITNRRSLTLVTSQLIWIEHTTAIRYSDQVNIITDSRPIYADVSLLPGTCVFTVRRYALHGISYRNFVCLSVRHTRGLCPHGSTYDRDFFTIW